MRYIIYDDGSCWDIQSKRFLRKHRINGVIADIRESAKEHHKKGAISCWKKHGIFCDGEWDEVYDWYMSETHCNVCDTLLSLDAGKSRKVLDHDHEIDGYNIRGVICCSCNFKDVRKI